MNSPRPPIRVWPRPHRGPLPPFRGCGFQPRSLRSSLLPLLLALLLPLLLPLAAPAWQENSLLIWINGDKGYQGISEIGARFTEATGIPVTVEHPDGAPDKFANAAQSGKGPDIMIWAHDRLGEWADNGLLMPVDPSPAFRANVFPKAWEAFTHRGRLWGFPIAMEATTLIYNRDLISPDQIPADLDGIRALAPALREKGAAPILWDYNNTYFTWGLLAAGGAQIFARTSSGDYDPADVHVDDPSAVEAATVLVSLLRDGLIARSASYSVAEAQMNQGRLAMFISGPFAWENLRKSGIDFGIALVPGLHGQPGRPFVGVLGAMFNRSSPNLDLAQEFLEHWLVPPPESPPSTPTSPSAPRPSAPPTTPCRPTRTSPASWPTSKSAPSCPTFPKWAPSGPPWKPPSTPSPPSATPPPPPSPPPPPASAPPPPPPPPDPPRPAVAMIEF